MDNSAEDVIFDTPPRWQGFAIALFSGSIFLAFASQGHTGLGRSIMISLATILGAIRIFWPLRNRIWFWFMTATISITHLLAIVYFSWPNVPCPGYIILIIILIDLSIILGMIWTIANVIRKFELR
jgi:hypothetical protein